MFSQSLEIFFLNGGLKMLTGYRKNTSIGVGLGFLLLTTGNLLPILFSIESESNMFGGVLSIVGICIFIWGCASYAIGKGHHGAWGLVGILSFIGLIILAYLPDKHKIDEEGSLLPKLFLMMILIIVVVGIFVAITVPK